MQKRFFQWTLAATLICGGALFTACTSDDDNPAAPAMPVSELLFQWISDYEEHNIEGDGATFDRVVKVYEFFDNGTGYYERYLLNNGKLEFAEYLRGEMGDFTYTISGNKVTISLLDEFDELEPVWSIIYADGQLTDPEGKVYRHSTEAEREQILEWYAMWHGGNGEGGDDDIELNDVDGNVDVTNGGGGVNEVR